MAASKKGKPIEKRGRFWEMSLGDEEYYFKLSTKRLIPMGIRLLAEQNAGDSIDEAK